MGTTVAAFLLVAILSGCDSGPTRAGDVSPTPPDTTLGVYGKVTDAATGAPLEDVCVTMGVPGARCWGKTDAHGNYAIDMVDPWAASPGQFEVYFVLKGYATDHAPGRYITGTLRIDYAMHK